MNQLFNLRRFANYFCYEVRTGAKKYALYFIAAPFAALLMLVLFNIFVIHTGEFDYKTISPTPIDDPMSLTMQSLFFITFGIVSLVAASMTFSMLSTKSGRISSLMIPASQFEKYVVRWILYMPVVIILSFLVFEAVDLLRCAILALKYPMATCIHPLGTHLLPFDIEWIVVWAYLSLSATCILGSSIWPSMSIIKIIIANFVISTVFSILTGILAANLFTYGNMFVLSDFDVYFNENVIENAIYTLLAVYSVICYVLAYFRFREIEIIQRW